MVFLLFDFHEAQRQNQAFVVANLAQIADPIHVNHGKKFKTL